MASICLEGCKVKLSLEISVTHIPIVAGFGVERG